MRGVERGLPTGTCRAESGECEERKNGKFQHVPRLTNREKSRIIIGKAVDKPDP
jgi:hypothetical protein